MVKNCVNLYLCACRALGMEYVDLYLVHYTVRMKGKRSLEFSSEDLIPFDMKGTWEAMEESHRLGLAKATGVSNSLAKAWLAPYSCKHPTGCEPGRNSSNISMIYLLCYV